MARPSGTTTTTETPPHNNNHQNNNNNPAPASPAPPTEEAVPPPPPGVQKSGYLRRHNKHGHRRFFVLRAPPEPSSSARLEYYESEKKWRGKAASSSPSSKRCLLLGSCLAVHKRADARHKHLIALYTREEYWALAAESEQEQEAWYQAIAQILRSRGAPASLSPAEDRSEEEEDEPGSYSEVWQVSVRAKGLGQSRQLSGLHRLCLATQTVALVRPNCRRPSASLQLMNIRRCGHSDSFFFMELGRSAFTGPGELWMQADDAVVAQNIHETILEAMKALRGEPHEFRPRSKSQSSASSSSSGGALPATVTGAGLAFMCSRPISVPGPRRHHHNHHHLPPSQTGLLRRSRTDILAATTARTTITTSNGNRGRTTSEGDGCKVGLLSGSPLSLEAAQAPLSHSHSLTMACCPLPGPSATQSSRSLALGHSPSLVSRLGQQTSSCSASASGSPGDPAGFVALDDLGSSLTMNSSNLSNTPETPPGQELDNYMAMERGHFHYHPCLCEGAGRDRALRKRTYSLTTPAHHCLVPLSSASLDEYTLMRATLTTKASSSPSPRMTSAPYHEDYCDVDIGSGGTSSSSSLHLGCSGGKEEGYMLMAPQAVSILPVQDGCDSYLSLSPARVSPPGQVLYPLPYRISSESSSDDSGYMHMWGTGTGLSGESPDGRPASGDYINMSPLFPPLCRPSPSASCDGFNKQGSGRQSSCVCSPSQAYWSQPNALGERKNSDQYMFMSSPEGRLNHIPKAEVSHTAMPLPLHHSRTEYFLNQQEGSDQLSHHSLGLLLPSMDEPPTLNEPQSPSGEYVNISYSQGPLCYSSTFLLGSNSSGRSSSLNSSYTNTKSDGSRSGAISVESLEGVLLPDACPSPGHSDKPYVKVGGTQGACLSSPLSEAGDYTEMLFTTATAPPQPISHKPEPVRVSSPIAGLKRLTLSGLETFIFTSPPPDPNHGAKVIRADPQGRRRHSSETFSSTTTVTPVSPSFAHNPKRHNSASVENVSLRKNEGLVEEQNSSPMCRETSAGFQQGLNHIALGALEGDHLANAYKGKHKGTHPLNGSIDGTYTTTDFQTCSLNEASVKE
ncbi:insulin receptor substrate 2 isoform X2 [Sceloporus undulatus]|uniref:insulin receptor substrate 2 isoform X2 n=1 Tax=Sceloporus undulatus TaxID=8520 RepID=UPI001C4DD652|nr:insulin receptor substrate 2 isoform X2 [Sceloporus undulatus]